MKDVVLSVRFLLEVVTVFGVFSGVFLKEDFISKVFFAILAITIIVVWARYGAPNSVNTLHGISKFILEIIVYSVGVVAFFQIFGNTVGSWYAGIVVVDLALLYLLGLQGN